MNSERTTIKKSPFIFLKWLIIIEFFFAFLPLILATLFEADSAYEGTDLALTVSYPVLMAALAAGIQILIIFATFMAWVIPQYVIDRGQIFYQRGTLFEDKQLIQLGPDISITVRQGILARIFDYGTLKIQQGDDQFTKLKDLPNPEKYRANIIELSEHLAPPFRLLTQESVVDMIQAGEGHNIEFKASLIWDYRLERPNKDLYHPVMKNIAAFMNSQGGSILIGVHDNGQILGLEKDLGTLQKPNVDGFENVFGQAFNRMIGAEFRHFVLLLFPIIDEKVICHVEVRVSNQAIYLTDKGKESFYIRTGNGSQPLSMSQTTKYMESRYRLIGGDSL